MFLARAIVGTAIACPRVAVDGVKVKGLNDAVLLNGAGVEAASTVICSGADFGKNISLIPIADIIHYFPYH
jgi:hypothetical protein